MTKQKTEIHETNAITGIHACGTALRGKISRNDEVFFSHKFSTILL
jgi:hypothetical protein